jgi:hypothetical protein
LGNHRGKISNLQHPIADLEHPFAMIAINVLQNDVPNCRLAMANG